VSLSRLKNERIRRGWSQAELGRRASVRQTDVGLIEIGRLKPTDAPSGQRPPDYPGRRSAEADRPERRERVADGGGTMMALPDYSERMTDAGCPSHASRCRRSTASPTAAVRPDYVQRAVSLAAALWTQYLRVCERSGVRTFAQLAELRIYRLTDSFDDALLDDADRIPSRSGVVMKSRGFLAHVDVAAGAAVAGAVVVDVLTLFVSAVKAPAPPARDEPGERVTRLVSVYGWWFHFAVGPAHGPVFELGVIGAALATGAAWLAVRLDRLDS
jgi:hypothetical protein